MRFRFNKTLFGVVLLLFGLLLFGGAINAEPSFQLPRGKGENCVEPTELMRRYHMEFLFHQRDATVRAGIRTPKHSLIECVQCHVQRHAESDGGGFIPIDSPGQFCQACHQFTSVQIDCFECHRATPDDAP